MIGEVREDEPELAEERNPLEHLTDSRQIFEAISTLRTRIVKILRAGFEGFMCQPCEEAWRGTPRPLPWWPCLSAFMSAARRLSLTSLPYY
jgi:hypothetical protein